MKLNEFYKIADEIAPKALSDEICKTLGWFDNSGILIDTGEEIRGVLFSLDLSFAAIERAAEAGANLIVTHHPAMYGKFNRISANEFDPLGEKLVRCLKNGISVISMHLNLDCAVDGTDSALASGIKSVAYAATSEERRKENAEAIEQSPVAVMHPLSSGGYGRAYEIFQTPLGVLAKGIQKEFSTERVLVYGDGERKISKVASFCGAGGDEEAVAFALKNGADLIVSSDFKHHVLTFACERGLAVLSLTHYASEEYGFKKYYEKIRGRIQIPCGYHTDESLL